MHSTASDGSFNPAEVAIKAAEAGLSAICLTDHENISGVCEFKKAAEKYPKILALCGSELAASYPGAKIEVLAIDIKNTAPFAEWEKSVAQEREVSILKRLDLLQKNGYDITMDDISFDENGQKIRMIMRPHIALALLKKGYVDTASAAHALMSKKGPAYVKKSEPALKTVISFIRDVGAVPVLAHPCLTEVSGAGLYNLVKDMKKMGLMGIEVFHSEHTPAQTAFYFKIAKSLSMIMSGGSDFHGASKPDIFLGVGKGNLNIPDCVLDPILTRTQPKPICYAEIKKILPHPNQLKRA
jgi:predicted metal-dependent phosphoesterase TrpH